MADRSEFYQKIKEEVKIIDYASSIGFTVLKRGNKYFTLKEHDSVIINPDKNCYWRNSEPGRGNSIGKGGSVIDFAMEFGNMSMYDAISDLARRITWQRSTVKHHTKKVIHSGHKSKKSYIQLPQPDKNMHRVFAYLVKTRCISQSIVQELVKRKMIYQDANYNCVFVGYDIKNPDKAVFACRRGTNTFKPFYGDVKGCDYEQCFYTDNASDKLIITESVIDAMSVMTILKSDWKQYNYLVLSGTGKWEAVNIYLKNKDIKEIYIATDNDESGIAAARQICCFVKEQYKEIKRWWKLPPKEKGKDWNKVLQEGVRSNDIICWK